MLWFLVNKKGADNHVKRFERETFNNKESWSLKSPRKYERNHVSYIGTFSGNENEDDVSKDIRMLESMFHVSAPTQIYKHWLNAVLYYVYSERIRTDAIDPTQLRNRLYTLACTYMLDRYLCDVKTDFELFIYKNDFKAKNTIVNWEMIDKGCDVENFVFNFYDYITWKMNTRAFPKFEFTYRTSVEHFYPQCAMDGYPDLDESTGLHRFGNLCLISRGMNSKFSNNMPKAKYDNFGKGEGVNDLSLKLNEMMQIVSQRGEWSTTEIFEFEEKARKRILNAIVKEYGNSITEK